MLHISHNCSRYSAESIIHHRVWISHLPRRWWERRRRPGWFQRWPPVSPRWHRATGGSWTTAPPRYSAGRPESWWGWGHCARQEAAQQKKNGFSFLLLKYVVMYYVMYFLYFENQLQRRVQLQHSYKQVKDQCDNVPLHGLEYPVYDPIFVSVHRNISLIHSGKAHHISHSGLNFLRFLNCYSLCHKCLQMSQAPAQISACVELVQLCWTSHREPFFVSIVFLFPLCFPQLLRRILLWSSRNVFVDDFTTSLAKLGN